MILEDRFPDMANIIRGHHNLERACRIILGQFALPSAPVNMLEILTKEPGAEARLG
ncbi:hypothetical protein [Jiella sp. M17.18]|uniref:hypothetical protein n=1 Tax=Jiella sp. M17.18 TaxID=3234247 RepID=UPI0034DED20F